MKAQIREIRIIDIVTHAILPPFAIAALWVVVCSKLLPYLMKNEWMLYVIVGLVSYFLIKRFLIGLVLVYKAFAPLEVRGQCRFTPTCSTYMVMAIRKWGIIIGVTKGILRIRRCKPPNGGVDYP